MKDPGPNVVELLQAILAKTGVAVTVPPDYTGSTESPWPVLYKLHEGTFPNFGAGGTAGGSAGFVTSAPSQHCGNQSIYIQNKDASPAVDDEYYVYKMLWLPVSQAVRLQHAWECPGSMASGKLLTQIHWFDGTNVHKAEIQCLFADASVSYMDSAGVFQPISTWDFGAEMAKINKVDLVVDFANNRYHWLNVNEHYQDMTSYALYSPLDGTKKHLRMFLRVVNTAAIKQGAHVDSILLTEHLYSGP